MTDSSLRPGDGRAPFPGLRPSRMRATDVPAVPVLREPSRLAKSLMATVPVVLVGTLAMANVSGAIDTGLSKRPHRDGADATGIGTKVKDAFSRVTKASRVADDAAPAGYVVAEAVPTTYTVRGGDTVSGIASHFGVATASVLALNGLSWKSLIFPGQVLKLTASTPAAPAATPPSAQSGKYTIVAGDTMTAIARKLGVSLQSLLQTNGLSASSIIYSGRTLIVPGASTAPVAATSTSPVVSTPPMTPAVATTPIVSSTPVRYTIVRGDTVTSIAKKFGVTIAAVLSANGMTASSIIYAGRTLNIPSGGSTTGTTTTTVAQVGSAITPLSPAMRANASTIITVGKNLGVPSYGIVVALAAAAQESGLQNLSGGDRDSVGLFQQRPSTGWGTPAQLMNTTYASELFYGGPSNPNKGTTRGLLDITGWQSMTVTQAAQAVQISAYPDAYAKWEASARAWLAQLG